MLYERPWLPAPTPAERDEITRLDWHDGQAAIVRLAALSERCWNESELGVIGRKVRKFVKSQGAGWREDAKKAGLSPLSLLMLFSSTASHLVEPLMASALARGIVLNCDIVEYQEPEVWLAQNIARLGEEPPNATLISLDRNSLRLQAAIGDAADAEACIQSAVNRVAAICDRFAGATRSPVLVENLPADAIDPQDSSASWLPGSPRLLAAAFNQRLAALKSANSYLLFDVAGIADLVGQDAWGAGRYWYTARMPFSPACVPLYAHRLTALLAALHGKSRRVLVLDLDNTLWGGVIGDDGIEGIVLGGNSAVGKAHGAIQKMAKAYRARGILLCVASKNTKDIALDAFRRHPEMILREDDITLFEINWENKAGNIRKMAQSLNLGLESFVFLDDNPVERKHIRDALPAVAVPELPADPALWLPTFQAAGYFEQQSMSEEDLKRAEYYKGNIQRTALQDAAGDQAAFLKSLQMTMPVAPFDALGRKRITQLIAKSNQFNLTTRRYSEAQIAEFETDPHVETFQIRLTDIFGDNGMIAVVICRKQDRVWEIDTWLMSCRVLGRGVEQATLNTLVEHARTRGAAELHARFIPTPKNGIVKDHYEKLGFLKAGETETGETEWTLRLDGFTPNEIPIEVVDTAPATRPHQSR
jgi:FkbH-like protein